MAHKTISLNGLDVTVPAGWDSESFINPAGMSVLRLGSFEFNHDVGDDSGQTARASMMANDVLINIIDFTATDPGTANDAYKPVTLPLTVDGSQAIQQEGYSVPAAVIRGVRIDGHNMHVSVAFGGVPPSKAQVAVANAVLQTLAAG